MNTEAFYASLMILGVLYCIPLLVAMARDHCQLLAIVVLNLLLGWTLLGWCGALVWACTTSAPSVPMPAGK